MAVSGGVSLGLVSNIIKSAATLDESHLEECLQRVDKKCSDLKNAICQVARETYDEFLPHMDSTIALDERVREMQTEFKRLSMRVDNDLKGRLVQFSGKKKEIEQRIEEMETKINFVQSLLGLHQDMEKLRHTVEEEEYTQAATLATSVSHLLGELGRSGCDAKVFVALKTEFNLLLSTLRLHLQDEWTKFVCWKPAIPVGEQTITAALKFQLSVPDGTSPSSQYKQFTEVCLAMRSLFTNHEISERIKRLSLRILEAFIKPLILRSSLRLSVASRDGSNVISLLALPSGHSAVQDVLVDMALVVNTIQSCVVDSEQKQWMTQLGDTIEPEITPLLIKHRLSEEVTKGQSKTSGATALQSAVLKYESAIKAASFVPEKYSTLSTYVGDVDKHVAAQNAQQLLAKAREILKRPLHNTTTTGPQTTQTALEKLNIFQDPSADTGSSTHESRQEYVNVLQLTFAFPSCLISESVKEFMDLVYDTLKACGSSSPSVAVQLYSIARDMIELFMAVVGGYHKRSVLQLPRNAAVLHNDCMYVSHHLITLGHQFRASIPVKVASTFIDFVPQLRKLADDCFVAEIEKQTANIREFLSVFTSLDDVSSPDKREIVYRCVRQAMLHLYNLCKVYADVLPTEFYHKHAASLLGVLIAELIDCTIKMEDIAATDAGEIYALFDTEVIAKSSLALSLPLNEDESLLSSLCPNWERLKELAFVLNASQLDIVKRWDSGKGELAKQFSAGEVKHLIRALFRNTDRRANTLAKIT